MIEAYRIGISLTMGSGQLAAGLQTVIDVFGRIQKAQRDTQAGINEMASGVRAVTNAVKGLADAWERVASSARRAAGAASGVGSGGFSGGGYSGPGPRAQRAAPLLLGSPNYGGGLMAGGGGGGITGGNGGGINFWPQGGLPGGPGGGGGGGGNVPGVNLGAVAGAYNAFQVLEMVVGGIGRLIDKAKGLNDAVVILEQRGVSAIQARGLEEDAYRIASSTPGRTYDHILNDAGALRGIIGQQDGEADALASVKQILPQVERTAAALASVMPGTSSDQQMHLLMRAIELRGGLIDEKTHKISSEKFSDELEGIYKVLVTGGGLVTANDLVNVMQQAGPMARMMDADGFYKMMMATILDMKGARAGTALSAAGRQMFGGVMSKRYADELENIGVLPPNSYTHNGSGAIQLTPEARALLDKEMQGGLFAFVQNTLRPALEAKGFTGADQQNKELYRIASTETFRRILALFLQNSDQVLRDGKLLDQTPGSKSALDMARTSSIGFNLDALGASISNFAQSVEKANAGNIIRVIHAGQEFFDFLAANEQASTRLHNSAVEAATGDNAFWKYAPWHRGFWLGGDANPDNGVRPKDAIGAKGSAGDPVHVTVTNAGEIGDESTKRTTRQMERTLSLPNRGQTGFDTRMSPAFQGSGP